MSDRSFSQCSASTWGSRDLEVGGAPGPDLQVGLEAALAREREALARRQKDAMDAQASRWKERMKDFCASAREKVEAAEEAAERRRKEGEAAARRNAQLVSAVRKGREKEKVLEEEKVAAKAELLVLEREVAKLRNELVTNHEAVGEFEARMRRLEAAREPRAEVSAVAAVVAAAASLAWWVCKGR